MLKLCVICHTIGRPYDKEKISWWVRGDFYDSKIIKYFEPLTKNLCPMCENRNCMIPINSPRAERIIIENNLDIKEYIREKGEPPPKSLLGIIGNYLK